MTRTVTPALTVRRERSGFGRSILAVVVAVLVLLGSWAVLIGAVVLVVRRAQLNSRL